MPILRALSARFSLMPGAHLGPDSIELLPREAVEKGDVLEPAPVIVLEQVARDHAAGHFVGVCPHEHGPLVARLCGAFGQKAANVVRLLVVASGQALPHLLLTGMV